MSTERAIEHAAPATMICAIGASAGGLAPVEEFFDAMPANTNAAFVVVQHLSPDHESMMVSLLSRNTQMPVEQAVDGSPLLSNHVYLISPGTVLSVIDERLHVEERSYTSPDIPRPIDHFFSSMASNYGRRSIAIVLSGTGSDGTDGIAAVHRAGGVALAQDHSAAFDGMPNAAATGGFLDAVMDPTSLAGAVIRFVETGQRPGTEDPKALDEHEERILSYLSETSSIDFREYKVATTKRRLERRMALAEHTSMSDYADLVRTSEKERAELVEDLFIDVTEFFRDTVAFSQVEEMVMPSLVQQAANENRPLRIWIPGCATGEEAYSLTMLAAEAASKLGDDAPTIQTFATDLHMAALETAGQGRYSASRVNRLTPERRDRFFERADDEFVVSKELRSMVTFARHNLLSDPPFTRVDLVSCRNLLIYFRTAAQERAISSMSFALRQGGVLFLGPSETLGFASPDYEPIDPTWRLWRKEFDYVERKYRKVQPSRAELRLPSVQNAGPDNNVIRAYDAVLQDQFASGLLLNDRREISYVMGGAKDWLEYPSGRPVSDVLALVRDTNLRLAIGSVLRELEGGQTASTPRQVIGAGLLTSDPIALLGKRLETGQNAPSYLIYTAPGILPVEIKMPEGFQSGEFADEEHVIAVELELRHTRDTLQSLLQEQEVSNEELNATNEELIASNEELQSTNEELSSVNEELRALNDEHQRRIDQVLELSADLEQLMSSTEIAVLFLAEDQTVRRFNEPARHYFRVRESDIGRPFADLTSPLHYPELTDDIANAFENGQSRSRTVRNTSRPDQRLVGQVSRYELRENRSGVLIALIDVTQLEIMEEERTLASALKDFHAHFALFNRKHEWTYVNKVWARPDLEPSDVLNRGLSEIYPAETAAQMKQENEEIFRSGRPHHSLKHVDGNNMIVSKYIANIAGEPHIAGIAFDFEVLSGVPQLNRALLLAEAFDENQTLVVIDPHGLISLMSGPLETLLPRNWLDPEGMDALGLNANEIREGFKRALEGNESLIVSPMNTPDGPKRHAFRFAPADQSQVGARFGPGSVVAKVMSVEGLQVEAVEQHQRILELEAEVERLRNA